MPLQPWICCFTATFLWEYLEYCEDSIQICCGIVWEDCVEQKQPNLMQSLKEATELHPAWRDQADFVGKGALSGIDSGELAYLRALMHPSIPHERNWGCEEGHHTLKTCRILSPKLLTSSNPAVISAGICCAQILHTSILRQQDVSTSKYHLKKKKPQVSSGLTKSTLGPLFPF